MAPLPEFDDLVNQYNVSAKLSNSEVRLEQRIRPEALRFLANSAKAMFQVCREGFLMTLQRS